MVEMKKIEKAQCPYCYNGFIVKEGDVFFCHHCKKEVDIPDKEEYYKEKIVNFYNNLDDFVSKSRRQ